MQTVQIEMIPVTAVSKRTNLSEWNIRNLCREGKIRFIYSGKKWLINWQSVCDYLARGETFTADNVQ